jgi:predicted Zn-dependent peptidase
MNARQLSLHEATAAGEGAARITTLDNGLRIVTEAMPHVATATVGVVCSAGSRAETEAEHGLAHFLEHMAFKGTARRNARQIAEEIEAVGGDLNAATSVESTAYHARVLGEHVPLAIDILGDILTHSTFEAGEIEREKGVILQEIAAVADTPDDLVFDVFSESAFAGQAIGRPILGTAETVTGLSDAAIRGFLAREYRPERMVVSAAGQLDHDAVVEAAANAFGDLPRGDAAARPGARYSGGERRLSRRLEQAHVVLGFEAPSHNDPASYAAQVFTSIVGGGMSSRLFQEVREKRGLAYAVYAFNWGYVDTGLFGLYLGTGQPTLAEGLNVSLAVLAETVETATEAEIARAKAQLKVSLLMALESTGGRSDQLARHLLAYDRLIPVSEMVARIDAVDAAAIRAAGRRMLASPPTLSAIGPLKGMAPLARLSAALPPRAAAA